MPELPEVEVLARHLRPQLIGRRIRSVLVRHPRVVRPNDPAHLTETLRGATLKALRRRGKFLLFDLSRDGRSGTVPLVGHLGMTGRLYLCPGLDAARRIQHLTVALDLGDQALVFEDPRRFGRFTLDTTSVEALGPEPDDPHLTPESLRRALDGSRQSIKVKLLDQTVLAGVGNIYASEALHLAHLSPRRAAGRLSLPEAKRLLQAIRKVLLDAIRLGGSLPLDLDGHGTSDGLFYYGGSPDTPVAADAERFRVYDRAGCPCPDCGSRIRRLLQAGRSTYFCPSCQT
ncbi:MAG: bifunctional DNA-formamidopyrimidine glycosylase/DNA-(apurinic or apyrimidinic site) lyase [Verrucomicrobiales bacterium]|nr:bifunctional DNA-formamidopyrimidine glycosylase/DNA-(apurinic or apyrimidinic site) lyase [Verrucomicrobiales bacterium]